MLLLLFVTYTFPVPAPPPTLLMISVTVLPVAVPSNVTVILLLLVASILTFARDKLAVVGLNVVIVPPVLVSVTLPMLTDGVPPVTLLPAAILRVVL